MKIINWRRRWEANHPPLGPWQSYEQWRAAEPIRKMAQFLSDINKDIAAYRPVSLTYGKDIQPGNTVRWSRIEQTRTPS